jgi:phosphodiesterase/alkaline phosphatase D-like protein
MTTSRLPSRRHFLGGALATGGALVASGTWPGHPSAQVSDATRPAVPFGVQVGEVTADRAIVWSATDRPATQNQVAAPYAACQARRIRRSMAGYRMKRRNGSMAMRYGRVILETGRTYTPQYRR